MSNINAPIIRDLVRAALQVFPSETILRMLCIIQGIHESNLLRKPSLLATKYNNLFGIKKSGTKGLVKLNTTEFENGKEVRLAQGFGYNSTLADSVRQYKQIISLPRYEGVREAQTFGDASRELIKGGYATDPQYAVKLVDLYTIYQKDILDMMRRIQNVS